MFILLILLCHDGSFIFHWHVTMLGVVYFFLVFRALVHFFGFVFNFVLVLLLFVMLVLFFPLLGALLLCLVLWFLCRWLSLKLFAIYFFTIFRELVPHIFGCVLILFFFIALQCWLSLFLCLVHCCCTWCYDFCTSDHHQQCLLLASSQILGVSFFLFLVLFCFALLFLLSHDVKVFNFFGWQITILICVVFLCFVFVHIYVSYLNHAISICLYIFCLHCVDMMLVLASHPHCNYIMLTWHLFLHCACTTLMLLFSSSFLFALFHFFWCLAMLLKLFGCFINSLFDLCKLLCSSFGFTCFKVFLFDMLCRCNSFGFYVIFFVLMIFFSFHFLFCLFFYNVYYYEKGLCWRFYKSCFLSFEGYFTYCKYSS
jgi:hypothetical protein